MERRAAIPSGEASTAIVVNASRRNASLSPVLIAEQVRRSAPTSGVVSSSAMVRSTSTGREASEADDLGAEGDILFGSAGVIVR